MATTMPLPPAPPAAHAPRPLVMRWTVEQFHRMGSMGWFEGRRPFLLDGVIWEQGPMNPPHASAVYVTTELLRPIFAAGWVVRGQMPLVVDEDNDPLPDVAVCPGKASDFFAAHPTTAALVVEVADTSLREDLTEKAERYATAGVADYWVLDLDGRRLLVFRGPQPLPKGLGATAYPTQTTHGPADRVTPLAAPNSSVLVSDLLP
ncbi:MAG: Uma2 family endonuclease [Isosphaera sp.]|nr:Uma2 family endonuclease [Isosphaera sp.]